MWNKTLVITQLLHQIYRGLSNSMLCNLSQEKKAQRRPQHPINSRTIPGGLNNYMRLNSEGNCWLIIQQFVLISETVTDSHCDLRSRSRVFSQQWCCCSGLIQWVSWWNRSYIRRFLWAKKKSTNCSLPRCVLWFKTGHQNLHLLIILTVIWVTPSKTN